MGLTALEAMASGVAVVVPKRGGAGEFCRDRVNALLADTQDEAACLAAAESLILDASLRTSIRLAAIDEAARHSPEAAALRLLQAVFGQ
jgi:glycosyltransferase involved in cell wall biosynthesis